MHRKPRTIVFASGTPKGGGSGVQELVENSRTGVLNAEIVAIVSNYPNGGVYERAKKLGVQFIHFPEPREAGDYKEIVNSVGAQWCILSGWVKLVKGLDPRRTINIHPGPLPEFGGPGMYGHFVHEKVMAAYKMGQIKSSAVSMHFVTEKYDDGPVFFRYPVLIRPDDTPETLAERVNKIEHGWQSAITNLIVHERISWDGKNPRSLKVPDGYPFHQSR